MGGRAFFGQRGDLPAALRFSGLDLAGLRADVLCRHPFDALGFEGAPINPLVHAGAFQGGVAHPLPRPPQHFGRSGLGHAQSHLARLQVAVAQHDMGVGIVGILALIVDSGQPCHPALGHFGGEGADQLDPLHSVQFTGQGDGHFVDDAGVFAIRFLLLVQPCPRLATPLTSSRNGHVGADHFAAGACPRDVAHMRPCRSCGMGRSANAGMLEVVNRHASA